MPVMVVVVMALPHAHAGGVVLAADIGHAAEDGAIHRAGQGLEALGGRGRGRGDLVGDAHHLVRVRTVVA